VLLGFPAREVWLVAATGETSQNFCKNFQVYMKSRKCKLSAIRKMPQSTRRQFHSMD